MFCDICRKEKRESLNILLSEESKRKRHRQNTTSLQVTALAWLIESVTGGIVLLNYLLGLDEEREFYRFIMPLDVFLCSVMIPACYVLKSDEIKKIINHDGWRKFCRDIFTSIPRVFPATADGPHQNIGKDVVINAQSPIEIKQDRKENPKSDEQTVNHSQNLNRKINLLNDDSISVLTGAHNQTSGKKNEKGISQEPTEQPPEENDDDVSTISYQYQDADGNYKTYLCKI